MALKLWMTLAVILLKCLNTIAKELDCPDECTCWEESCSSKFLWLCKDSYTNWTNVHCVALNHTTLKHLPSEVRFLNISKEITEESLIAALLEKYPKLRALAVKPANSLKFYKNELPSSLSDVDLSGGSLKHVQSFFLQSPTLRRLSISRNDLESELWDAPNYNLSSLEILDLSHNKLNEIRFGGELPELRHLYLQGNYLKSLPDLRHLSNLRLLDASANRLEFTDVAGQLNGKYECQKLFPPGLRTLILKENSIQSLPYKRCNLFSGLVSLEHLDLGENDLHSVTYANFPDNIAGTLKSINLAGNSLRFLSPETFSHFRRLQSLSLSRNHLRTVQIELLSINQFPSSQNRKLPLEIDLEDNLISCDCEMKSLPAILRNRSSVFFKGGILCTYPSELAGYKLEELTSNDLECYNATWQAAANVSCPEYQDCDVRCTFNGLPHPQIHWVSPIGEVLSLDSLAGDLSLNSKYSLSEDGSHLVVKELRLSLTGMYKCVATNSLGSASTVVQVGVIPYPIGSVIAIAVSAIAFSLAIAVNCANMCKCYCENLREEVVPKKEEEKMESPIHSKQKGLHESVASLNANKYYRKYDFTCQHIFLDAVIKGAHTVKQTLHDARNSEFSNNVWGYASHLRDRFHIELPSSVQFPRVSMPSLSLPTISMPNISMPSMPNLQSINTNIERLGTSVITRSHTLASSVGSVFTLRWLRYGGNSDNDSGSDSQEEDGAHDPKRYPVTCITTTESSRDEQIDVERAGPSRCNFPPAKSVRFATDEPSLNYDDSTKQFAVTSTLPIDELISEDECSGSPKFYQFETSV